MGKLEIKIKMKKNLAVSALLLTCNISQYFLEQNTVLSNGETSDMVHNQSKEQPLALMAPGCKGWRQKQHSEVLGEVFGQPSKGLATGTAFSLQGRRAPGSFMKGSSRGGTFLE